MAMAVASWLGNGLAGFAKAAGDVAGSTGASVASGVGANVNYEFPSEEGLIAVREESRLAHMQGTMTRARRTDGSGREYDFRRLRAAPAQGEGFVTLERLEAINREVELALAAGRHPHILRSFGTLTENATGIHCRLLLYEPCVGDLQARIQAAETGGVLPLEVVLDIGHQLALGLGHLCGVSLLYGPVHPNGVLHSSDGVWKLADFSHAARLPLTYEQWRLQQAEGRVFERAAEAPPELRGGDPDMEVTSTVDVWLLGHFLASLLLGKGPGGEARAQGQELAIPPTTLEAEPRMALVWLLLHWPLAEEPADRLVANEVAAMCMAILESPPREFLDELPRRVRRTCCRAVQDSARQLAMEQAAAEAPSALAHARVVGRLAGLSLDTLRGELVDGSRVDRLCEHCGTRPCELALEEEEAGQEEPQPPRPGAEAADDASPPALVPLGPEAATAADLGAERREAGPEGGTPKEVASHAADAESWEGNPFANDSPFAPQDGPADLIELGPPDLIDL